MPIFVARQWIRHRSASTNEYSGRYSEMNNEFYIPDSIDCAPQSADNKQGRSGTLTEKEIEGIQWLINASNEHSYETYKTLLGDFNTDPGNAMYDVYSAGDGWFDESYPGLAKELARMVLPVNNYTEWYWKCDLHNLLHFIFLRSDSHAQKEIQVYANAIEDIITPIVPLTMEAYQDYVKQAKHLSRMEVSAVSSALQKVKDVFTDEYLKGHGLTKREIEEFKKKFNF
ncbi:MAG: FAD-dependent thymidylate synthase [Richelia sp. RM2_1_2]|nr:FAD-dependent thymidylate synthase [Richelia sp. RM2_1_2]